MCRWFTYLGDEPQLLEDVLLRPNHSIVKQIDEHYLPSSHTTYNAANDQPNPTTSPRALTAPNQTHLLNPSSANDTGSPNPLTNMDGFGVGWWTGAFSDYEDGVDKDAKEALRPVVYKNIRPPLNDLILRSLARGTETRAVVAHIRAGTGLTPVVETNCHPYTFGRHLFCHNGVLGSFHLFKPQLLTLLPLRYQMAILGTTDSEHIAALYFYHLCGDAGDWESLYPISEMTKAMQSTLAQLESLKSEAETKYKLKVEQNALNLLVNSGSSLVAIRYASPPGEEPPSLYYSTTAGATLNRKFKGHPDVGGPVGGDKPEGGKDKKEHGKHVIVASEPSTYDQSEWELIERQTLVAVGEDGDINFTSL